MDRIHIEPSEFTPGITFDPSKNIFKMWGMSRPEDLAEFYFPLTQWWEDFSKHIENNPKSFPYQEVNLDIKIEYFNSASSKMIYDIIFIGKSLSKYNITYSVNWYYHEDDEDIYESGMELAKELNMEFNLLSFC